MTYAQTQETIATIIHGRKALADNAGLRDAWTGLLSAIADTPLESRVAFHRYVRLVHGTTAGLVIPQVITDAQADEIRQKLADLRAGTPLILDELDDDAADTLGVGCMVNLELASDRPDRG